METDNTKTDPFTTVIIKSDDKIYLSDVFIILFIFILNIYVFDTEIVLLNAEGYKTYLYIYLISSFMYFSLNFTST